MQSVMLMFKQDVSPEDQEHVLTKLNARQGVIKAARLKPEARNPDVLRMAFVYVDDSLNVQTLLDQLSKLPEIDSASLPPQRGLVT